MALGRVTGEAGDIWLKADDMAADALARGADGEAILCRAVSTEAFNKGVELTNQD